MEAAPSRTAMLAAVTRGHLRLEEAPPWVLDDAFALVLIGPVWQELREGLVSLFPGQVVREISAAVCTRSRYAEDRLAAGAFAQYVILGAGLDSFAWRRPDLLRSLKVFEVDHPASQAWKLERVRDLALPLSDSQVFVPADFEAEPIQDALHTAGFDSGSATHALRYVKPQRHGCGRGPQLARRGFGGTGPSWSAAARMVSVTTASMMWSGASAWPWSRRVTRVLVRTARGTAFGRPVC